MSQPEKQFVTEFLEIYKSNPCLWKIKSKEYSDRYAKSQAYDVLVKKMKEVDKNADRETVVKKLNNLRTTYRKELKKVNSSQRSGAGEDYIYVPHLWYFNLLSFLRDQETPRKTISNIPTDEEAEANETEAINFEVPIIFM